MVEVDGGLDINPKDLKKRLYQDQNRPLPDRPEWSEEKHGQASVGQA